MIVPWVLLLSCITGSASSRTLQDFVLLTKAVYLVGLWRRILVVKNRMGFMVNIIHLKKVNSPNPLCPVKGHEKNYLKVSPTVLARQKAVKLWDSQ